MTERGDDAAYLVTAEEIAAMDGLAKTHFLNPRARRVNKSLGDLTGLTGLGVHVIAVEPGDATTEPHVHHHEDEAVFVLEGEATAVIGEAEYPLEAGDFIGYRKGGLVHTIRNTGSGVLRSLVVGERAGHDVVDYPRAAKRLFRHPGMAWNLVDHAAIEEPRGGAKA